MFFTGQFLTGQFLTGRLVSPNKSHFQAEESLGFASEAGRKFCRLGRRGICSSKRTLSVLLLSLILGLASGDRSSIRLIIIRLCF